MPLTLADLARLQGLHQHATTTGWATRPTSSGGVILTRGPGETASVRERHPQSHLQVVPDIDGELIAESRNALPDLLALAALGLQVQQMRERIGHTGCDYNECFLK